MIASGKNCYHQIKAVENINLKTSLSQQNQWACHSVRH